MPWVTFLGWHRIVRERDFERFNSQRRAAWRKQIDEERSRGG
jgi:hypothetical protein